MSASATPTTQEHATKVLYDFHRNLNFSMQKRQVRAVRVPHVHAIQIHIHIHIHMRIRTHQICANPHTHRERERERERARESERALELQCAHVLQFCPVLVIFSADYFCSSSGLSADCVLACCACAPSSCVIHPGLASHATNFQSCMGV